MASDSPSVLIVRLDAIGDALTVVPLIAALRRNGLRVGIVLREVNAGVLAAGAVDRIHIAGAPTLLEEIRRAHYAYALIPTEKPIAYRIAREVHIPVRVGFENGWGKPLKTLWVRRMCTETIYRSAGLDPRAPHECEVVFKLARRLVPDAEPPRDPALLRPLVIGREPPADERIAVQITDKWERLGARIEDVVELIGRIGSEHPIRLIGSHAERAYCASVAAAASREIETFETIEPWKDAIAASKALVAPDSGAVHVAGMTGTRVVACFAPQHFALQTARWSPWAAHHRIVKLEEGWPLVAADALGLLLTDSRRAVYKG